MTTVEAFVADIKAKPEDDALRLIYADWLDENGQPAWAEFIRAQCELARIAAELPTLDHDYKQPRGVSGQMIACFCKRCRRALNLTDRNVALWQREADLLLHHADAWCPWRGGDSVTRAYRVNKGAVEWADKTKFGCEFVFQRGFIEIVRCLHNAWLQHGPAAVRPHPVQRVDLVDKRPTDAYHIGAGVAWVKRRDDVVETSTLDPALFDVLEAVEHRFGPVIALKIFSNPMEANDALSTAGIAYARGSS